ncbi:TetR/AcrR family transcriptional regulator [Chitinophagaceae bacterium LB-8]|uniref:TetR/AcrR family transcriptional regulator n=1 Tax=Paraflavisolibacter caeni TaxID=2982496 RepID=A0A9X3BA87_9BACT|nr:TetR/AcrR family transcriptional regulator [Paraflavisolibacter caeni]MCU7552351.1 TetR/AcrR family transcriptional regulator [Paraflavisolibacter caeni]
MVKNGKDCSTEEKILEAAKKVFITKGMAGARMQDIADEAGINKALLHYYFRSKDKLFETIFAQIAQRFLPRINDIFNSELSINEKIEAFCKEYIDNVLKNPFIPLFVINEMNKQPEGFVKKLFGNEKPQLDKFITQINNAVKKQEIKQVHPLQLIINTMALCVFPFLAKPIIQWVSGMNQTEFRAMLEDRKKSVPQFIIHSIKN